ncbi:MAG: ATP-binding protein [Pseudomonadota bacterium]|nr:ATP-binding protein [Pseudomonadota bacterium]
MSTREASPLLSRSAFRPSFRQLLLAAFLLMAGLMGAVALRGQFTLEQLLQRSRAGAERTLQLTGNVERLGEEGRTMERAARQFVVLGDPPLREIYTRAAAEADSHLQALAPVLLPASIEGWRQTREQIEAEVDRVTLANSESLARDQRLAVAFRQLDTQHNRLAEQVRDISLQRNAALQAELEAGRVAVGRLLLLGLALAGVLALALALGLARPLRRVETAIDALGANQLDERIEIPGPSDVRQIGRRLDGLRQRLAADDADKARFLRHVSHELKTPLAALREGVALLQDGVAGPLSDNQREVARILHDNTAALQRRIEDLLRFNAAAFAAQRPVRRRTDIGALIASLVDSQQLQWRARTVAVQVDAQALHAEVDPELLTSAVGNLLANAIRFSPAGTTIRIDATHSGDGLQIDVADQGLGIDPAERDRIFEPFYRGQRQPEDSGLAGTGIGLSIVAETVAAHGGRVSLLKSDPARSVPGAHFRIELPHALVD